MKRLLAPSVFILFAAFCSGCTTLADARDSKGTGISKVYNKPFDVVWNVVVESVSAVGLKPSSVDKSSGTILAKGNLSAFSWGENVAIFLDKQEGNTKTKVEVVNKAAFKANVTAKEWASKIFHQLDERL